VQRIYIQDLFVSHINKDATSFTPHIMRYKIYLNPVHTVLKTFASAKYYPVYLKSMSYELICLYIGMLGHRQAYGLFVVKHKIMYTFNWICVT